MLNVRQDPTRLTDTQQLNATRMKRNPVLSAKDIGDTHPVAPTPRRLVRSRARALDVDEHVEPHHHPWAQVAYCASGLIRVTVDNGGTQTTYILPPSRAVSIPPGAQHSVNVMETAEIRTVYMDPDATPSGWKAAKRLRSQCESVLRAPAERATLAEWSSDIGASERTVARLFRTELGTSYPQWRQQAVLADALPMLARGVPVSQAGAASRYTSDSAFSAMFKAAMGQSPSYFQSRNAL